VTQLHDWEEQLRFLRSAFFELNWFYEAPFRPKTLGQILDIFPPKTIDIKFSEYYWQYALTLRYFKAI
jgi:hypothetical protein